MTAGIDYTQADASAAWERAWRIYPETNVEDGMARTVYIAGYLAGIEEGKKIPENKALTLNQNDVESKTWHESSPPKRQTPQSPH